MHALQIHEYGEADCLAYEDAPLPEPRTGEVRVRIAATGVNFVETYQRRGWYPSVLPFIPGAEFAGTVDAVGPGVEELKVGDRVATASGKLGYAEYGLARTSQLVPVPEQLSLELAAAVMLQGITAHYLALSTYPIQQGDTVLVHAAAGGVGQLLVQVAKRRGARVIGTCSNEEKARLAREA
ncbi:MAG TPA: alcohol dehydrogenase catalytic domain-containing protein, partial [Anaerolineaceae bacterium]